MIPGRYTDLPCRLRNNSHNLLNDITSNFRRHKKLRNRRGGNVQTSMTQNRVITLIQNVLAEQGITGLHVISYCEL